VSPDSLVDQYGSDVFRAYLMFMGPYDEGADWNDSGITGLARFQEKAWRIGRLAVDEEDETGRDLLRRLHVTIRDVTEDLEKLRFNTAISRLMELSNALAGRKSLSRTFQATFIQLIAPFMPHLAEELWERASQDGSVFASTWPGYDPEMCKTEMITIGVTVNGKRRGEVTVPRGADDATVLAASGSQASVARHLEGKEIIKKIVVPGKIVNYVVR
ncbi:MAG: class I tRNA ligase family protein, partial [Candidatus Marinimicrobia bacterium]|nr:class I tRNA ligase family protein [Candidatus Neomarinimicrobiota bacterium]